MFKNFRVHFFSGLLALAPLFFTILVISYLLRLTDALVVNPLFRILPFHMDATFKIFVAKLAIGVVVVLFVALIGVGVDKLFARQLVALLETVLKGIPVINKVYGSIREIAQAFFGDKKGVFKRVVLVEYPRKGLYSLGFVTQDKRWEASRVTGRDLFSVFVPSPPNPATGYFIFVPKEEVIETQLTVEQGIRLVISGGAAVPPMLS